MLSTSLLARVTACLAEYLKSWKGLVPLTNDIRHVGIQKTLIRGIGNTCNPGESGNNENKPPPNPLPLDIWAQPPEEHEKGKLDKPECRIEENSQRCKCSKKISICLDEGCVKWPFASLDGIKLVQGRYFYLPYDRSYKHDDPCCNDEEVVRIQPSKSVDADKDA